MFPWLRRDPKHLVERRQSMLRAMADYPPYEPPHRQGPNFLDRVSRQGEVEYEVLLQRFTDRGRENLDYFLKHREVRMNALSAFLEKFDVQMGFGDAGLAAVSAWCPQNCGSLVPDLRDQNTRQVFFQMLQPWTGQWRGFNVIFDLGTFLGESLIVRSPRLHWIYQPGLSEDGVSNHSGYGIGGFKKGAGNWFDPMGFICDACTRNQAYLRTKNSIFFTRPDFLIGQVRDFSSR